MWELRMKKALVLMMLYSQCILANPNTILWQGEYYAAVPIKKEITPHYCDSHSPGTFTHRVNDALAHPLYTDKKIKLAHAQFKVDKVDGIYLIHGSFLASGKYNKQSWQETIHYFLFKRSPSGVTQGIWYTPYCKGLYRGRPVNSA